MRLTLIDWSIVAVYAAVTMYLGWRFGRRKSSVTEYFIGTGSINHVLIGVSLFATLLSTVSYLSMPGEALGKGPMFMLSILGYPIVFVIVAYGLLPVYKRHKVVSAYELLEARLGLSVRLLGALMFVLLRLVWMSLLMYLTAKAMTIMLGVGPEWIPYIVLGTGLVAIIYTSVGGLQAVVITDLLQTVLLYGGSLVVLLLVTIDLGGFSWIPTEWHSNWDRQPIISSDLSERVTVFGTILTTVVWAVSTAGGDQTSVQRFMATGCLASARRAFGVQMVVTSIVVVTLGFVGFALLGFYEAHPDFIDGTLNIKDTADNIFPHFIANQLPIGVSGLVIAAMFAAAMSSMDSGVNSITAVVMTDFVGRLRIYTPNVNNQATAAKILAFTIGAIVLIGTSQMDKIPGNITAVTSKTANLLTTPLFCLFIFALFVRRASPIGVWIGAAAGTSVAIAIAFSGPLLVVMIDKIGVNPNAFGAIIETGTNSATGETIRVTRDPISFQWIAPFALIANLTAGTVASLIFPQKHADDATDGEMEPIE